VVSDIPECSEVVEDKAVIFKKSNIEDLKTKLTQLCNNPTIVKQYKNGLTDYIIQKYKWCDAVEQTLNLYKK